MRNVSTPTRYVRRNGAERAHAFILTDYRPSPSSQCGRPASSMTMPDGDDLPMCKRCAARLKRQGDAVEWVPRTAEFYAEINASIVAVRAMLDQVESSGRATQRKALGLLSRVRAAFPRSEPEPQRAPSELEPDELLDDDDIDWDEWWAMPYDGDDN